MNYHIGRDGQQLGEFPEEQIRPGLQNGTFRPTDLAWTDGMGSWQPLGSLPQFQAPAPGFPPAPLGGLPGGFAGGLPISPVEVIPPNASGTSGLAVTSLICGIIGLCFFCCIGWISAIIAVICGHIGLSQTGRYPHLHRSRNLALAGLTMGYIGLLLGLIFGAYVATHQEDMQKWIQDMQNPH